MNDSAIMPSPGNLSEQERQRIASVAAAIDFRDPALSISYGADTMNNIARFADGLLSEVRTKDAGPVGEILGDLLVQVKRVDIGAMGPQKGGLSNLPIIGKLFNSYEKTVARFTTLAGQVETISGKLENSMISLLKDIEILEQLYAHNRDFHNELTIYIEAGVERLEKARKEDLPRLQAEAEASGDTMKAQEVRDLADKLNRFEKRLHDLRLSRTITIQTAPQIRLIQGNNQTLAEKIQTSILATIPIWKNQMVLALSLYNQQKAARLQKSVADTTNELLRKNADMLQQGAVDTAREVERSIVDIETVREVQGKLVSTIEETLRIAQEGRQKRQAAEIELENMEGNLRTRLAALSSEAAPRIEAGQ